MTHPGTAIHNSSSRPMVSVVIPFLNPGAFFEEAIRSVIAQTHSDWELLLVDDGATDGSLDIARGYTARHPEGIFYLAHPGRRNCGVSASRNLGLREARGAYVAFLDADDVWMPDKLERQLQLIGAHPEVAMTYGPAVTWYSWANNSEERDKDKKRYSSITGIVSPPRLVSMYLRGEAFVPSASGVLVRKQAALAVGGFVDKFRWAFDDDLVFYSKLALRQNILVADEGHYYYRQHARSGSTIACRSGLEHKIRIKSLVWLRKYMAEGAIVDAAIDGAIADQLRVLIATTGFRGSLRRFARVVLPSDLRRWLRARVMNPQIGARAFSKMIDRKWRGPK
jgi:glycosyltransferase involved in cell wall biosynthesis